MACGRRAPDSSPPAPTTGRPRTQRRARGDVRRGRRALARALVFRSLASARPRARTGHNTHNAPARRQVLPPGADCRARALLVVLSVVRVGRPCARLRKGAWWDPAPLRAHSPASIWGKKEGRKEGRGAQSSVRPGRRNFFQVERRTHGGEAARRNHARRGKVARGERTATPGCIWVRVRGCLKYSVPPWAAAKGTVRPSVRRVVLQKVLGQLRVDRARRQGGKRARHAG